MKLYDCFTFFNELELLDLRLMTLNDVVDFFVLVEANRTHTGAPKEFIFEKNKAMFAEYLDKIIYVKVEDLPIYVKSDFWRPENFQRNCISRGLGSATAQDKIIVSDMDEIPDPAAIERNLNSNIQLAMVQKLFYYHVNCLQNQLWRGSILTNYNPSVTPQQLRHSGRGMPNAAPGVTKVVQDGGWHYSFMGGPEKVRCKIENIAESHLIIDKIGDIESIKNKINIQQDLWDRTDDYAKKTIVDIKSKGMAPECIGDFIKKYPHFYFGEYEYE